MTADPVHVCASIANCILGDTTEHSTEPLGQIILHPHQKSAVHRIHTAISEFGGALLCDEVGLGKTYVALAMATRHTRLRIIAPAVLRPMWHHALDQTSLTADFISFETLSRLDTPPPHTHDDFIIVDEAHHARTPSTKRYANLSKLCTNARVLLLSATPIHNTHDDLTALLTLIVGDRATTLTNDELSRLIIRRTHHTAHIAESLPTIRPTQWTRLTTSSALFDALQQLPPAVPPAGSALAHTLLTHSLVRQWTSSDAALRAALQRRLSQATAMLATMAEGRHPSADDLRLWTHGEDALQFAFPTLLLPSSIDNTTELATIVRTHADALTVLLDKLIPHSLTDHDRAQLIRTVRQQHPGEHIVAFSQYAATIHALFRALRPQGHVAALTATGGMIASGTISRADILKHFTPIPRHTTPYTTARPANAPDATDAIHPNMSRHATHTATDITLLLTTDLLSEGVNLQHASVVIHLDLPWTSARLDQRVGRVARINSPHSAVSVYGFLPPTQAEEFLRATSIVRTKAHISHTTLGTPQTSLPSHTPQSASLHPPTSIPAYTEAIHDLLRHWRSRMSASYTAPSTTESSTADPRITASHTTTSALTTYPPETTPLYAFASSSHTGFLAACLINDRPLLLAGNADGTISTEPSDIYALAHTIDLQPQPSPSQPPPSHPQRTPLPLTYNHAQHAINTWFTQQRAASDAGVSHALPTTRQAIHKRTLLNRITALTPTTPITQRSHIVPFITHIYNTLTSHPNRPTPAPPIHLQLIALLLLAPPH